MSEETHAALQQLIGNSVLDGQAYEYDRQLADMMGPRLTGSANYMKAAEWAEQQFKSLGLKNVHTEEWTIPATWEPEGPAVGRIVNPVDHHLHIYSASQGVRHIRFRRAGRPDAGCCCDRGDNLRDRRQQPAVCCPPLHRRGANDAEEEG